MRACAVLCWAVYSMLGGIEHGRGGTDALMLLLRGCWIAAGFLQLQGMCGLCLACLEPA